MAALRLGLRRGVADAGASGEPLVVILNDNGMSIDPNVGGVATHLGRLRLRPGYYRFKKGYRALLSHIPGGRRFYRFTHRLSGLGKPASPPSCRKVPNSSRRPVRALWT